MERRRRKQDGVVKAFFLRQWNEYMDLYTNRQIEVDIQDDLEQEFGPSRLFEVLPKTLSWDEAAPEWPALQVLDDEFMDEHFASLERIGASFDSVHSHPAGHRYPNDPPKWNELPKYLKTKAETQYRKTVARRLERKKFRK